MIWGLALLIATLSSRYPGDCMTEHYLPFTRLKITCFFPFLEAQITNCKNCCYQNWTNKDQELKSLTSKLEAHGQSAQWHTTPHLHGGKEGAQLSCLLYKRLMLHFLPQQLMAELPKGHGRLQRPLWWSLKFLRWGRVVMVLLCEISLYCFFHQQNERILPWPPWLCWGDLPASPWNRWVCVSVKSCQVAAN